MKPQYWIAIFGIMMIATLEALALRKGIDGLALSASAGGIGAIAGYVIKRR